MSFGFGSGDVLRKQVEVAVTATGQQAVDDLAAATAHLENELDGLANKFRAGSIDIVEFLTQVRQVAPELAQANRAFAYGKEAIDAYIQGFNSIAEARAAAASQARDLADAERTLVSFLNAEADAQERAA